MPEAIAWNGTYSVARPRRSSVIVTGLNVTLPATDLGIWVGYKTVAGAPTAPDDLHASKYRLPIGSFANKTITTLSQTAGGEGRVVVLTELGGGDLADAAAGAYVWVGVTETDDPTDEFLALAGPRRATA